MSEKYLKKVEQLKLPLDLKIAIDCLIKIYRCIAMQIKVLNKRITEQARKDAQTDAIYQSTPGIGPIWARTLANELESMEHFTSEKKLFSYLGLTPTESSSGEKRI